MKKLVVAVATVFVAAVLVSAVGAGTPGGTVVASGFSCGLLDHNGGFLVTNNSSLTLYASGKAVLKCEADGPGGLGIVHWNFGNTGLGCGMLQFGATTQWDDKVGSQGNAQLTCTIQDVNRASEAAAGAGLG